VTGTSRIVVEESVARVYTPYALREIVKSFPGRRWDPDAKCWIVLCSQVWELADALRVAGSPPFVTGPNGQPYRRHERAGRTQPRHPREGWADLLLDTVGADRVEKVFKALSKVLHPDVGGDAQLMRELLAARERRGGGAT
jgi:hypothetical protein